MNAMFVKKRVWVPGPVIIGAGPSGLATAACLKEKGVPSLIIEKENCIASLWKLKTYDRLRLHLPKRFCGLPFMEWPQEIPAYPTKHQFISYLEAYAKHFSINTILGAEVQLAEYDSTMGFWHVQTNEFEFVCQWLIVATGENAEPVLPDCSGVSNFEGRVFHSCLYGNGAEFKGKKVLVVGCGNSGMEIGLDLCNSGAQASIAVRDKVHILPREMFGKSTFGISMRLLKWFPVQLVDWFLLFCSWLILGATGPLGFKRPQVGPLEVKNLTGKTPVLDVGTLAKIKVGQIKVVPAIQKFTTSGAEFLDGSKAEFDTVILATGYRSNVPSWLKGGELFNEEGHPKTPFPDNWKGKNGLYSVGFNKKGLLGVSMDAQKVAADVSRQWHSERKHLRMEL
ncbi:indole-3-pyruvate monooxygenase [Ranunculus cassubicifolius]